MTSNPSTSSRRLESPLREARERRGWSQDRLAQVVGCTRTYIVMLEGQGRGKNVGLYLGRRIALALGVTVDVLWPDPGLVNIVTETADT